jgi:hypothetical protein
MDVTFEIVANIIKDKLYKYFERGFNDEDLIILIPNRTYEVLRNYFTDTFEIICEKPLEYKIIKNFLWGIEIKKVDGLNEIYVSLK